MPLTDTTLPRHVFAPMTQTCAPPPSTLLTQLLTQLCEQSGQSQPQCSIPCGCQPPAARVG